MIEIKIASVGISTKSSSPTSDERPNEPSNIASTGVKQQIAVAAVPIIPTFNRSITQ